MYIVGVMTAQLNTCSGLGHHVSTGKLLMRGAGAPLKRVLFTLHHDLQEKEPKLQKATMMSMSMIMKVHVSSPCTNL